MSDTSVAEDVQDTINGLGDDKTAAQHLGNLRALNAHHVNQTQAMMRQVTAKAYGIEPQATPFPGTTTYNSKVTQASKSNLPAIVCAGLLTLAGAGLGMYGLGKAKDLFVNQTTQVTTQPNPNTVPVTPTNPTEYDPSLYQFKVVPYAPSQPK